mgnify:CR=1 FL=1
MPETGNVVCVEDFFATIESYLNKEQVEFVRKAYDVAAEAHASQRRKSGEPYIIHPLGVATILSQLQLDELTLAAAFLHDVVEDTEISLDSLQSIALQLCSFYGSCGDSNELIQKIQNYLNRNYMDSSLSLSKISEEFHISENYFSFLFKKEVSENFSVYLEKLRMAKAKELVLESSISISELYQYTGYNNAASFRRAFKKKFGVSPKEMREKAASGL